jgi:putative PIN family toxin of toxin-antitoxin system
MLPLRLVIDTNVLVSAALKPEGLQRTPLSWPLPSRRFSTCRIPFWKSMRMCSRVQSWLSAKGVRQQLLQLIKNHSHIVTPSRRLEVCTDPDDNVFLECADAARADYLITGNQKHFPRFWKKTKIITTREFISLAAPHLIK